MLLILIQGATFVSGCGRSPSARPSMPGGSETASRIEHVVKDGQATPSKSEPANSGPGQVSIDNFTFNPETLEIRQGAKVVWTNRDDVPHTVRSTDELFRSGTLDTDDTYERVFSMPGTYEYYCGVHRHMAGKIVVK